MAYSTPECSQSVKAGTSKNPIHTPRGVELSLQHKGLTQKCEQGGTESGTVVEDSKLVQMLQALTSLTDDERELLAELLKKMG